MIAKRQFFRSITLLVWSVFLTGVAFVFTGATLRLLRKEIGGRLSFIAVVITTGLLLALKINFLALLFFIIFLICEIHVALEKRGTSLLLSGTVATLVSTATFFLILWGWSTGQGLDFNQMMRSEIGGFIDQFQSMNPQVTIKSETIVLAIPSIMLVSFALTDYLSILFERRLGRLLRQSPGQRLTAHRRQMADFSLPDWSIWFLIAAVFGAFFKGLPIEVTWIASNSLNVLLFLYFLQGLAVVSGYLAHYKIRSFWRFLIYLLLVTQLFILVGVLGFLDYWIEFRKKLTQAPFDENRAGDE